MKTTYAPEVSGGTTCTNWIGNPVDKRNVPGRQGLDHETLGLRIWSESGSRTIPFCLFPRKISQGGG